MSEENKTDDQKKDTELENSGSVHLWSDELALKKSQKKIKHLKRALVIVVIAGVLLGWLGGSLVPMSFLNSFRSRLNAAFGLSSDDKIAEVLKIMENDWYFGSSIDNLDERLKDQALTAITSNSEDTHTEYMSAEETSSFAQSINRNYVGIGVGYIQNGDTNMIEEVFKDSPAEKAGVKAGDIIHAIDGTVIDGMSSSDIKDLIQGDEGTKVSITFIREGQYMTLEITRAAVSATAFGKKLDDGTIYLRLAQFGEGDGQ
jgi:carboxyl-terminal processing protease